MWIRFWFFCVWGGGELSPWCSFGISSFVFWNFKTHKRNKLVFCVFLNLDSCDLQVILFLKHKRLKSNVLVPHLNYILSHHWKDCCKKGCLQNKVLLWGKSCSTTQILVYFIGESGFFVLIFVHHLVAIEPKLGLLPKVFKVIGSKANISGTCYFKVAIIGVCQK
jgi:hypothetical protein